MEGYYCLGPYGRRVSFIAQQYRALNLVSALHRRRDFRPGERVAVIGGGLAGMTAAIAFLAHGCHVHLFERDVLMSRQRETEHRMVHPSINLWPSQDLRATTNLPFLEWHIGQCVEVTDKLLEQFLKIKKANGSRLDFSEKTDVQDVWSVSERNLKVHHYPERVDQLYNLVLLTVGFGVEKSHVGFEPVDYWREDGLEANRNRSEAAEFIVSGCGDGGLIDALRLVHRDFGRGKLAFRCAALLKGSEIERSILGAESACLNDAGLPALASAYLEAGKQLAHEKTPIANILRESIAPGKRVYLLSKSLEKPFSLNAAPIHKLLIAHAMACGAISYRQGEVERKANQKIKAHDKEFAANTKVIIRHGAEPHFANLLGTDVQHKLQSEQSQILDGFADRQWQGSYPVPDSIVSDACDATRFAQDRFFLAHRAAQAVLVECNLRLSGNRYVVEYFKQPDWMPADLFGVPVEWHAAEIFGMLDG